MGSGVVLTYKRKRLFSRTDQPHTPSAISESDCSAKPISGCDDDTNSGMAKECKLRSEISIDQAERDLLQCENYSNQYHGQQIENSPKQQSLCSSCMQKQDSKISDHTENSSELEEKSQGAKSEFHTDELAERNPGEKGCQIDSSYQPDAYLHHKEKRTDTQPKPDLFVNSGSECEDRCKETLLISPHPDIAPDLINSKTSDETKSSHEGKDVFISETDEIHKAKRQLAQPLITFSRRSKQKRNIPFAEHADTKSAYEKPAATTCSMNLKKEKDTSERNAMIRLQQKMIDDQLAQFQRTAENAPSAAVRSFQDSDKEMIDAQLARFRRTAEYVPSAAVQSFQDSNNDISAIQGKDNHHVIQLDVKSQGLSDDDRNLSRMPSGILGERDSLPSLDISVSPPAARDIDCNIPLDCGSDENNVAGPSKVNLSADPTGKMKKDASTSPKQKAENDFPVCKGVEDSQDVSFGNSSKYNYLQLFPEGRSNNTAVSLAKDPQKAAFIFPEERMMSQQIKVASMQSLPDEMINGHTCRWPTAPLSREVFPSFFPSNLLSNHKKMMHDNYFSTRARAEFIPSTWSEEELDCLWIGVRRHGRGNWDSILLDRRLRFLPSKTARDLSVRWEEEQFRLLYGNPISKYAAAAASPPDYFPSPYERTSAAKKMNQKSKQRKDPAESFSSHSYRGNSSRDNLFSPYERTSDAGPVNGNLPHWLREAVSIPPRPLAPAVLASAYYSGMQRVNQVDFESTGTSQQQRPRPNKRNGGKGRVSNPPLVIGRGNTEPQERRANKQNDLIVIPSDASSEETISDDQSNRH